MVRTHQPHHSVTVRRQEGETEEGAYVNWGEYDNSDPHSTPVIPLLHQMYMFVF